MSTREKMRRELRDLAKLASVMPKEHPSGPGAPDSGSRVTVPPAIATVPPPSIKARPPAIRPPTPLLPIPRPPPRPKSGSLASVPPAAAVASGTTRTTAARQSAPLRGGWGWVMAGGILGAAMMGGLALGHVLTPRSSAASARAMEPTTTITVSRAMTARPAVAPTELPPPHAVAAPALPPASTAHPSEPPVAILSAAMNITGSCPPPVMAPSPVRTVHPPFRRPFTPAPTRGALVASASSTGTAIKSSVNAKTAGARSLDDLIRKAASSN